MVRIGETGGNQPVNAAQMSKVPEGKPQVGENASANKIPTSNDAEFIKADLSGLKVSGKYTGKEVDENGKKTGVTKTIKTFIDGSTQVEYKDKNTGVTTTHVKGANGDYKQFTSGKFDVLKHSKDYKVSKDVIRMIDFTGFLSENCANALKDQIASNGDKMLDVVRYSANELNPEDVLSDYNHLTGSSLFTDLSKTSVDKGTLVDIAKHMFANHMKNVVMLGLDMVKAGNFAQYVNAGPANGESVETYLKNVEEYIMNDKVISNRRFK